MSSKDLKPISGYWAYYHVEPEFWVSPRAALVRLNARFHELYTVSEDLRHALRELKYDNDRLRSQIDDLKESEDHSECHTASDCHDDCHTSNDCHDDCYSAEDYKRLERAHDRLESKIEDLDDDVSYEREQLEERDELIKALYEELAELRKANILLVKTQCVCQMRLPLEGRESGHSDPAAS